MKVPVPARRPPSYIKSGNKKSEDSCSTVLQSFTESAGLIFQTFLDSVILLLSKARLGASLAGIAALPKKGPSKT